MAALLKPSAHAEDVEKVPFTFSTSSPLILKTLNAGAVLDRASILITTPFDAVGATVKLGTSATPDLVFKDTDVSLGVSGQYETTLLSPFLVSDLLLFTISPNGSVSGSGLLIYKVKR